jgi:hypothetical protein
MTHEIEYYDVKAPIPNTGLAAVPWAYNSCCVRAYIPNTRNAAIVSRAAQY